METCKNLLKIKLKAVHSTSQEVLYDLVEEICLVSLEVIIKASTRLNVTSHQNSNDLPLRAFLTRLLV